MMRSLYSGVSGLRNHQIRMDVLGNNISNVNTNGFKRGRVNFQDIISQTLQGAARPTVETGGVNPRQVGLGMTISSIDTIFTQGSIQTTGRRTDLAIQGDGFFILKQGENTYYTRAGNYALDASKTLVNPANGMRLQGWVATQNTDGSMNLVTSAEPGDIVVPLGDKFPARETDRVEMQCNLNSQVDAVADPENPTEAEVNAGQVHSATIDVYDSQGNTHKVTLNFVKSDTNSWNVQASLEDDMIMEDSLRFDVGNLGNAETDTIQLTFNNRGAIVAASEYAPDNPNRDILAGENQEIYATLTFRVADGTLTGREQNIRINMGTAGLYDGVTQMASPSTTKAVEQNGYGMGYLQDFMIDSDGVVTGTYSNGQAKVLAQISMASFVNPGGLIKEGDNTYVSSNNSGVALIGTPNTQNRGSLIPGSLEMSNVDLSEEFTDMIVTQRGFQANSRIITTSDQMLQELLALKR